MNPDPGLAAWLQFALTPGIPSGSLRALLKEFGLPEVALRQPRAQLSRYLSPQALQALDTAAVRDRVGHALSWAEKPGCKIITLADTEYPRALLESADPPALIYARGRAELLEGLCLAVVGSRNATPQGCRDAQHFSAAFSRAGMTIVSGLALGVDAAAHRGGLSADGSTIAVLGTGVDVTYPRANSALAAEIAERGLLVSEFPLGSSALAHHFPRRNRVISGLSRGCLVIEAALASGSLITARLAADQGREVFAIPGSIHSPLSKGCHALIKSGAKLVESAEDVLTEIGVLAPAATRRVLPKEEDPLLACMGPDPVDLDSLSLRARRDPQAVAADLLRLEMDGRVAVLPGGLYQRLSR